MKNSNRLPVPQYSYRQSIKKEEREVYRRIALIVSAFFVILVIIWFFSTNFLSALGSLANGNESENSTKQTESLPLQAPEIDELPESTNNSSVTVSGTTNPETKVSLLVNSKEVESKKTDSSGFFKFEKVTLTEGLNLIKIIAIDPTGKKEESSKTITLDKTKPPLAVSAPIDGANFAKDTKSISVAGTTEADAIIHINGNQAVVSSNGKFNYNLSVSPGKNDITVEAVDEAGNLTVVKLNITVDGESSAADAQ